MITNVIMGDPISKYIKRRAINYSAINSYSKFLATNSTFMVLFPSVCIKLCFLVKVTIIRDLYSFTILVNFFPQTLHSWFLPPVCVKSCIG